MSVAGRPALLEVRTSLDVISDVTFFLCRRRYRTGLEFNYTSTGELFTLNILMAARHLLIFRETCFTVKSPDFSVILMVMA